MMGFGFNWEPDLVQAYWTSECEGPFLLMDEGKNISITLSYLTSTSDHFLGPPYCVAVWIALFKSRKSCSSNILSPTKEYVVVSLDDRLWLG